MQCQDCWLIDSDLAEPALQCRRDAGMQLLAAAAQQGAIGCILYQSVLESVLGVRGRAATEDQFGAYQLLQRVIKFVGRYLSHGADQFVRKRAPERRADLDYLPRGCETIEPRQQRGVERC